MVNELSHKTTIFEDPEIQTSEINQSPLDHEFNRVLFLKNDKMTLKTQGTINNSNNGQNFDSFDKSKLATNIGNQGNVCS